MCLTIYMVASAGGMVIGGFLAADPARCERIVGIGFSVAAALALIIGFTPFRRRRCRCCSGDGPRRRHCRRRRATCSSSVVARQRDRPRLRRRLFGSRHRPGHRAAAVRHADGPSPSVAGLARHRPGPARDGRERVPRCARRAGPASRRRRPAAVPARATRQTALRWRLDAGVEHLAAVRFHQSSDEKISTSL